MSFISTIASGSPIKTGQTVTVSFDPTPGDYGFEWTTTNSTLKLTTASTICHVYCQGPFSGTAIVKCSYKFRVGNSYTNVSKSWSFTYNSTGDEGGGGGSTDIGQVKLSDTSISIQEYETQSITIEQSLEDIKWTIIDSTIASIEPKFDGYLLEITGLKPGTTYARVSGKYMYNQIIEGLVCINVSKRNYQDGELIDYKTDDMHLRFEVINGKERTASLNSVEGLADNSKITVPSQIKGLKVVQIGQTLSSSDSFSQSLQLTTYRNSLKQVILPETVTTISPRAFTECSSLEYINLPNSLTKIGSSSFAKCSNLSEIHLPKNLKEVGENAFARCTSLKNVFVSEGVKELGIYMFNYCTSIETIKFPESLEVIGSYCFIGCENLKDIYIQPNLKYIYESAFARCQNLTNVYISDLSAWCRIRMGIQGANPLQNANNLICNNEYIEHLVIPTDVNTIGEGVFYGYKKLKSITITNSVTEIGNYAFYDCSGLKKITLTKLDPPIVNSSSFSDDLYASVDLDVPTEAIKAYLEHPIWGKFVSLQNKFEDESTDEFIYQGVNYAVLDRADRTCMTKPGKEFEYSGSNVSGNLRLPETVYNNGEMFTVVEIGEYSFYENDELTSVTLPKTVTTIGEGAFYECAKLKEVCIPLGISSIGDLAFNSTSISSIELPISITSIGNCAFALSNIKEVFIPKYVMNIGQLAFTSNYLLKIEVDPENQYYSSLDGVLFDKTKQNLIYFPEGISGDYTVPNSVISIKENAFFNSMLSSIIFSNSVTNIESYAVYLCKKLISIVLPYSIKEINRYAFDFCNKLEKIFYNSTSPITTSENIFEEEVFTNATLHVPAEAISTFKSTKPWKNFRKIEVYNYYEYPTLHSIDEAIEKASLLENGEYSEPYVIDFEPIVTFVSAVGAGITYISSDDRYFTIYGGNLGFVPGQIIRKGWTAKLHNYYGLLEFSPTEDTTIIGGDILTVPDPVRIEYSSQINRDLLSAVVYIPNVEFSEKTPDNRASFTGKLNNQYLIFYNNYVVPSQPAGTYDVIATIGSYYDQLQVQPIEFIKANSVDEINTDEPVEYYNLQGQRVINPDERGIYIRKKGQTIEKIIIP